MQRCSNTRPELKVCSLPFKHLLLRLLLAITLVSTLILPVAAQEVRKSDVVRVLESLHQLPGIAEGYQQSGFDAERTKIMLDHTRRIMANKGVSSFVADLLISAQKGELTTAQLGGVVQPLIDRGLLHLPLKEQLYYLKVETTVLRALSKSNCGRVMKETVNPEAFSRDNQRVVSRLNTPAMREYLRIVRKAAFTGVSRKSPPRISDRTRQRVSDRFFRGVLERAKSENLMRQLEKSAVSMRTLSNNDACRVGLMFVDAALEYEGPDKRTLIQLFLLGFE
jgi:hypothetical protein